MVHSDLPPGEKWRQFELKAAGLRDFARLPRDAPLNPFDLARFANLFVVDIKRIKGLSGQSRELLLGSASEEWSGGACSRPLPDGRRIVILNPNHGSARTNATLMEEICHVFLGHKPNRLAVIADEGRVQTLARDYRKLDEEAAYAIGAAALVPFAALRRAVLEGKSAVDVARHFRVSRDLIEYRLKVTRLWRTYKLAQLEQNVPRT
ncbi:MAG: ImmA/IrrE family metallo-endopeptidase [Pyrinomonadaceae bacterium]|nr:ImmA/IrrE family metallo-endopeptidase [Pyrinomonadaceae bacterium]